MKNLRFQTLHEAAIGVQRACDQTGMPDLHRMPYSRFSTEDSSLWWLCTAKARTAFNQGKFVLGKPDPFGFESGIACGLHVERGVKQTMGSSDWKLDDHDSQHGGGSGRKDPRDQQFFQLGKVTVSTIKSAKGYTAHVCIDGRAQHRQCKRRWLGRGVIIGTVELHEPAARTKITRRARDTELRFNSIRKSLKAIGSIHEVWYNSAIHLPSGIDEP